MAAAVLLTLGERDDIRQWMTTGDAGRADVALTHDAWAPDERRFPPSSFVRIIDLRKAIAQWVFGDVLPLRAVGWRAVTVSEVGWL